MAKIHTRAKRRYNLSRNVNQYHFFHPIARVRPKTFKTEQAAHAWAKAHDIKDYSLKKVKKDRKFQIVKK